MRAAPMIALCGLLLTFGGCIVDPTAVPVQDSGLMPASVRERYDERTRRARAIQALGLALTVGAVARGIRRRGSS